MKANELRIGNYVNTKNGIKIVTDINPDGYCFFLEDHVTPIPLTKEWLIKFGIKDLWIKESWKVVEDTSDGETFGWSMVVRNASHTKEIEFAYFKYVHQLQNLYFALTGKEL